MNPSEIRNVIEEFFRVIDYDINPVAEREFILILDKIALCSNYFDDKVFDEKDYPDPPKIKCDEVKKLVKKKFPHFGYYNIPYHVVNKISDTRIIVGDAIDDISGIYQDLSDILWFWENTSLKNALWHLNFSYKTHWGLHLRNLQWYIYNRSEFVQVL